LTASSFKVAMARTIPNRERRHALQAGFAGLRPGKGSA